MNSSKKYRCSKYIRSNYQNSDCSHSMTTSCPLYPQVILPICDGEIILDWIDYIKYKDVVNDYFS